MLDKPRHKSAVIIGTLSQVPNYPKKLKIYLNNASHYWQAVYWDKGKTYRRSLKTTDKRTAYEYAKEFYEQIIVAKYSNHRHLENYGITKETKKIRSSEANSFKEIASQWLIRKSQKWGEKHSKGVESRLAHNIFKYIGDKNIQRISRQELLELLRKMEERGAYDLVKRVLNDCQRIWQFAIAIGACKQDITVGLGKVLHEHSVVHFNAVSPKELPELMLDISKYNKLDNLIIRYALQLMALTFVRKNELLLARWNEFDLEKKLWKIPAARMKMRVEHIVPLSKQSLNLLNHIKRTYPSNDYVFHKSSPNKPLVDHALIQGLYWMGYKHRMTIHGFRAIASTILNEHGFRADVIEKQLAHTESNQVRRAYNRAEYIDERAEMMDWWSDYLEKITPFIPS